MATFPLTDPLVCGANCTLNVFDCPAERVVGKLKPLNVYPLPLALAWLIVTLVPPEFVRVPESVWLVPVLTLPKESLEVCETIDPHDTDVAVWRSLRAGCVISSV